MLRGLFLAMVLVSLGATAFGADCLLGDADSNGAVSIGEVQQCVSNFLGASNPASACPPVEGPRFVDNGDGTVTDNLTGLMWLKKIEGAGSNNGVLAIENATSSFSWVSNLNLTANEIPYGACSTGSTDGTSTSIVGGFNSAGYCDWRLPSIAELRTIIDTTALGCGAGSPCIDPVFGLTAATYYWSSSRFPPVTDTAWAVDFFFGTSTYVNRYNAYAWRAVRGNPL